MRTNPAGEFRFRRSDTGGAKPPRKDAWDRFASMATILVPATIALAGLLVSRGLQTAQRVSDDRRAADVNSVAVANLRVAQATVVNTLMKSLISTNPQERKIAIEAVVIALGEEGTRLIKPIAEGDPDRSVRDSAKAALVSSLFSPDADTRKGAAAQILEGWGKDSQMVQALVDFATQNKENANGIFNTVVVLSAFDRDTLMTRRDAVLRFLALAKATGDKTEQKATVLESQLRDPPQ